MELIMGAGLKGGETLREGYRVEGNWLTANVDAGRILDSFKRFLELEGPCLYVLYIEEPDGQGMVDVYYLDELFQEDAEHLLDVFGALLLHDGLLRFGLVSEKGSELGKHRCGVLHGYNEYGDLRTLRRVFEGMGIPETPQLRTAWDLISRDNPEQSRRVSIEGKSVPDLLESLKGIGLCLAERRAED